MTSPAIAPEGESRAKFRGDIEGLRAIAVTLVLVYHAGVSRLPGGFVGVDVFFVISGFLITTLLVTEMRDTGRISLTGFYARRAKRLLPAAGVVLIATAALAFTLLPRIRWADIADDVLVTAIYGQNWRLAHTSTDYLAQNDAPSPLQHFWSLAVEEQFYIFWPLLLLAVTAFARRPPAGRRAATPRARSLTAPLLLGLLLVAVPSLWFSVVYTASDPGPAYFVTTTRAWELAAGGAVALAAPLLGRLPRGAAAVLAWAGVATVVACGLVIDESLPFPGYTALAPVLGTAAVIAAAPAAGVWGPTALLGVAPLRWIGKLSYSLYLWHWPLIVVATHQLDGLTTAQGLLVVALSLVPAYLSYRFVEDPVRRSRALAARPRRALLLGFATTAAALGAGSTLAIATWSLSGPEGAGVSMTAPVLEPDGSGAAGPKLGAMTLPPSPRGADAGAPTDRAESITPDPLTARDDIGECRWTDIKPAELQPCTWGPEDADVRIVVVGDSHAQQWIPALTPLAAERGWHITAYTKGSCPFTTATVQWNGKLYRSCTEWNTALRAELADQEMDLVVTSHLTRPAVGPDGDLLPPDSRDPAGMIAGLQDSWRPLTERGIPVLAIRDTPVPGFDMAECVSENLDRLTECAGSRSDWLGGRGVDQAEAAADLDGVTLVDLNDAICPTDECAPVIGNVLVYRDKDHLTRSYARTLAPRLVRAVDDVLAPGRAAP